MQNCRLGPLRKERNGTFIIDDLGNRDSVNVRDRNGVDYASDNLTSKCDNAGGSEVNGRCTKDTRVDFAYDNLDRLTLAQYSIDHSNEVFTIDDSVMLGRRVRALPVGQPPKKRTKKLR
jgi:hypothetical protein